MVSLVLTLGNAPVCVAVDVGVEVEVLLVLEQDDGHFFLQMVQDILKVVEPGRHKLVHK